MVFMQLPIDLLKTFVVAAETKNFTAAGRKIYRSQSAVSMQMKRLAQEVGKPLFDVDGKQIRLSPVGELLLEHAQRILKAHDNAALEIRRSELKGKVRFGAPEDYASLVIPQILSSFAQEFPDIRVDVFCESSDRLHADLSEDKLDLAVCTAMGNGGEEILKEPVVWITSVAKKVAATGSIPLAVYRHNCIYRKWAVDALEAIGRAYHIAYMSPSIAGILAAVRSGLAVAPVGLSVVADDVQIIGSRQGFPPLPLAEVCLFKAANSKNALLEPLANHVKKSFESRQHTLARSM